MKKFITLALALILTLSVAVVAFAGSASIDDDNLVANAGVTGQYVVNAAEATISVDVTWVNADWTYTVQKTWNAVDHVEEAGEGVWSNPQDATTITLTNNSNCDITVNYTAASTVGATLLFNDQAVYAAVDSELAAVSGTGDSATVDTESVTLKVTGGLTGEYTDGQTGIAVGTVTITIAKA